MTKSIIDRIGTDRSRQLMEDAVREAVRQPLPLNNQPSASGRDAIAEALRVESADKVRDTLVFFLWECPSSMIPTRAAVTNWADVLETRGPEFVHFVTECRNWAKPAIQENT